MGKYHVDWDDRRPAVVVLRDRHSGVTAWAATTEEEKRRAVLDLFRMFDSEGFYDDQIPVWLKSARRGDADSARKILESRRTGGYEYEDTWDLVVLR